MCRKIAFVTEYSSCASTSELPQKSDFEWISIIVTLFGSDVDVTFELNHALNQAQHLRKHLSEAVASLDVGR